MLRSSLQDAHLFELRIGMVKANPLMRNKRISSSCGSISPINNNSLKGTVYIGKSIGLAPASSLDCSDLAKDCNAAAAVERPQHAMASCGLGTSRCAKAANTVAIYLPPARAG